MSTPYGYRETEDGDVVLTMNEKDFNGILIALGTVCGLHHGREGNAFAEWLALVNRINIGNPNFTPYEIPDK